MIANIRVFAQQLANPCFDNPKDLVAWMGAIQAQDYAMLRWAVGIRLKSGSIRQVEDALRNGDIVRTHVMRPTWHLVPGEDIRWMLQLSRKRIKSAYESYGKHLEITEKLYLKSDRLIEKILAGNKSMTKQEIGSELQKKGIVVDDNRINQFLIRAEVEGLVCSGIDEGKKATYALLEERIPSVRKLEKEEALAKLAKRYFQSHSPANLNDFVWWSGLSIREAKQAIDFIKQELTVEKFPSNECFIHESCGRVKEADSIFHFLPSFDEFLISYKDRTATIALKHYPKAFNNFGTFYPVIMHNGKIIGNWSKSVKKGKTEFETSFFEKKKVDKHLMNDAQKRYRIFMEQ